MRSGRDWERLEKVGSGNKYRKQMDDSYSSTIVSLL